MLTIQKTSTVNSGLNIWLVRDANKHIVARFYKESDAAEYVRASNMRMSHQRAPLSKNKFPQMCWTRGF
jgi:hypothetical protein